MVTVGRYCICSTTVPRQYPIFFFQRVDGQKTILTEKRRKKKHAAEDAVKKNHSFDQNNFRADDVEEFFLKLLSKIKIA
jgi:hypothetical protein